MSGQEGNSETVAIRLIDRDFLLACPPDQRDRLLATGIYLDRTMRDLRTKATAQGFDRLAVLAAISVTHELLALREDQRREEQALTRRIAALRHQLERVLDLQANVSLE